MAGQDAVPFRRERTETTRFEPDADRPAGGTGSPGGPSAGGTGIVRPQPLSGEGEISADRTVHLDATANDALTGDMAVRGKRRGGDDTDNPDAGDADTDDEADEHREPAGHSAPAGASSAADNAPGSPGERADETDGADNTSPQGDEAPSNGEGTGPTPSAASGGVAAPFVDPLANACASCGQAGGTPAAGGGCSKCAQREAALAPPVAPARVGDVVNPQTPGSNDRDRRNVNRSGAGAPGEAADGATGAAAPTGRWGKQPVAPNGGPSSRGASKRGGAGAGDVAERPASAKDVVKDKAAKAADKGANAALKAAKAAPEPTTQAVARGAEIAKKIYDRRKKKKGGQGGKRASKTANGRTGGGSGTASSGKKKAAIAAVAIVAAMLLAIPMLIVVVVVGGGSAQQATVLAPKVSSLSPDRPRPEYLEAYIDAGREHDVPWTLLAGIAKITTEQGRISQSDVADYGELLDRAPELGALNTGTVSFNSKGAPAPGTEIVSIGDSILVGAGPGFDTAMTAAGYVASHDGQSGASISQLTDEITTAFAQGAGVVVIQAGVNDVWGGADETTYRQRITTVLDASASSCVVWVNLASTYGGDYVDLAPTARRFNVVLAQEAGRYPNVRIADFSSVASRATQDADGLHLNASGNKAWVDVVSRAVSTCGMTSDANPDGTPNGASQPDAATIPVDPATAPTAPSVTMPAMTSGGAASVYVSAPEYSQYYCFDGGGCGPNPKMGVSDGEPVGVFALDPVWLEQQGVDVPGGKSFTFGGEAFDPHDVRDSADALAKELSAIRDKLVNSESLEAYPRWETRPQDAAALWDEVLSLAPVVWPVVSTVGSACPAPQPATLTWPLTSPVAVTDQGTVTAGGKSVLNAGMTMSGTGPATAPGSGTIDAVTSAADGTTSVAILHADGLVSTITGMASTALTAGAVVAPGDVLGDITEGGTIGFEVRLNGSIVDPRDYVIGGADLPRAGTTVDPQAGLPPDARNGTADPQAGTPIDPCTGKPVVAPGTGVPGETPTEAGGVPGGSRPGMLVIPVAGVAANQLVDTWGAPRSGGRTHKGIDIIKPIGTPLVAVAAGTIDPRFDSGQPCTKHSPPSKSKSITIVGDDGHRYYYGHLNTIEVSAGQRVAAGQRIGTVGQTGNACWSVAHLHFGIDESTDNPINPYPILAEGLSVSEAAAGGRGSGTNTGGAMMAGGGPTSAVGYAVYFGGLVLDDPQAGQLPVWVRGGSYSGGGARQGNFAPGSLSPKGQEWYDKNPTIAAIILRNFPPEQQDNALRIAACESNLNPDVVGTNKKDDGTVASRDHGLFQFNDAGTLQTYLTKTGEDTRNIQRAYDPEWSARAAFLLWQDHGWGRWSCAKMPTDKAKYRTGIWVDGAAGPGNTSGEYADDPYLAGYGTAPG